MRVVETRAYTTAAAAGALVGELLCGTSRILSVSLLHEVVS